jgi:N-acetylglucosaminyldiphosphoundecaprenol N-acetyl-beta-D-mannosaminyltransferase
MSDRVRVAGLDFDVITEPQLIAQVTEAIRRGQGGTIVTPNIDICRRISRDPASRHFVDTASFVVPDGVPLLWAARLAGLPLTERITGADLIFSLSGMAAENDFPIFVVGGMPGTGGQSDTAHRAAQGITDRSRDVKVVGAYSPPLLFNAARDDIEALRDTLVATQPKIVFVGLGFPKQERLIARLSGDLPGTWFIGCGAAVMFAAGQVRRAPDWVQRTGTEWVYRLINEPRRLGRRYLVHDVPFAIRLLAASAWPRPRRPRTPPESSSEPVSEGRTVA